MRAREFIVENRCVSGWQSPIVTEIPNMLGTVVIGKRLNELCEIVEVQLLYYNKNINFDVNNDNHVVYGIRLKNNRIIEFDYLINKYGNDIGEFDLHIIPEIQSYFAQKVAEYLNTSIGESMNNINNGYNLYELVPELKDKIYAVLSEYAKDNLPPKKQNSVKENTAVDTSAKNKIK